MKILLSSHRFAPDIGGLETVSLLLADAFGRLGHEVIVVTGSPGGPPPAEARFRLLRQPDPVQLLRLTRWSDLVFHNNVSLRTAWPLLLVRRAWVVTHQTWLPPAPSCLSRPGIKRLALHGACCIAISDAVAAAYPGDCTVIPNPYDDHLFRPMRGIGRDHDLVFVGRLVSDKGLPVLLAALARLAAEGIRPSLSVIGDGPLGDEWSRLSEDTGLGRQVRFIGALRGTPLVRALHRHRVMVIPSLWNEPFGVVALEAMACGCVVVGSQGGGLSQAIGAAGLTFTNGDAESLARALAAVLTDGALARRCRDAAPAHLARHAPGVVAARYLEVFEQACAR